MSVGIRYACEILIMPSLRTTHVIVCMAAPRKFEYHALDNMSKIMGNECNIRRDNREMKRVAREYARTFFLFSLASDVRYPIIANFAFVSTIFYFYSFARAARARKWYCQSITSYVRFVYMQIGSWESLLHDVQTATECVVFGVRRRLSIRLKCAPV